MKRSMACSYLLAFCAVLWSQGVGAQGLVDPKAVATEAERFELGVGKSKVVDLTTSIKRASLANPEVADTVVLSPKQIYLTGKAIGVTTLTLWKENGELFSAFDIRVTPDLSQLREQLHRMLPDEPGILVTAAQDHVTLSGTISNLARQSRALEVAEPFAPKKIVNLLQVGGAQQVMLEVRVAEMDRNLIRHLGVNLAGRDLNNGNNFGFTALNNITSAAGSGATNDPFGQLVTNAVNALVKFQTGNISWTGFIDALKQEDAIKVLAKPTLVAVSGQEAQFLSGGEFPFPIPQAFGVVTIQYKKFGVGLSFTPTVLTNNRISMAVSPEVSELDFSNALQIQGFNVPTIATRRATTVVELADGQSFAIAGLLRDNMRESIAKFPVLGDLPVLGTLFRSSRYTKNQTELVIIVTPHYVKPMDVAQLPLPTDTFVEPNDWEFYLMGLTDGAGYVSPAKQARDGQLAEAGTHGKLDGDFGHMVQ
ncbi:MAG TPA: type II and III secretion system protein family protein [Nitrospiraceae bacterium]|jgi:pilus assembly protein CpaC|nr:type II and III secretion system protein family protein [Nitrospiraceae bacterium]